MGLHTASVTARKVKDKKMLLTESILFNDGIFCNTASQSKAKKQSLNKPAGSRRLRFRKCLHIRHMKVVRL